jgi:hypothetical protein
MMGRHIPEIPKGTSLSLFVLPRVSGAKAAYTPLMGPHKGAQVYASLMGFGNLLSSTKFVCMRDHTACTFSTRAVLCGQPRSAR